MQGCQLEKEELRLMERDPHCDKHRGGDMISQQQRQVLGQAGASCSWTRREPG